MGKSLGLGLGACGLASVLFGTMFVPLAGFHNGDGFFTQFAMAVGIFLVGLVIQFFRGFPTFYPLAMLGGVFWSTGNCTAIPIINEIGMAIGVLMWNLMNLLVGWASGRFGMFGWINSAVLKSDALNGVGLALAVISTGMFAFVESKKPEEKSERDAQDEDSEPWPEEHDDLERLVDEEEDGTGNVAVRFMHRYKLTPRRLWAYALSLIAGCFYGLTFAPVIHIQDRVPGASQNGFLQKKCYFIGKVAGLDYVFSHYCGIFATSTFYFVVYSAYKLNRPYINPRTLLPGILGGILWAIAQAAWFVANDNLDEAVSFPIISRFPGLVCALWGVLYFKEITGKRNLILLGAAFAVTILGGVFSGLSTIL